MKFSNEEKKLSEFLLMYRLYDRNDDRYRIDPLRVYKDILVDNIKDLKVYDKLHELLLYKGHSAYIKDLESWPVPIFPLNGDKLVQHGLVKGPIFSKILSDLKDIWKYEFDFETDEKTLLNRFESMRDIYYK